jgi:hypothetical protein
MADTQHFVVSIDEGSSQGVYCAYCGKKIIPDKDGSGSYYFRCDCPDAIREEHLYLMKSKVESDLEHFLVEKTDTMQINELRTRIVVYEQHVHELKKRLQELMNKTAGVAPQEGISTLVVKLSHEETGDIPELIDEVFSKDYPPEEEEPVTFDGLTDFSVPEEEEVEKGLEACYDVSVSSPEAASFDLSEHENLCDDSRRIPRITILDQDSSIESFDLPDIEDL